MNEQLKSQVAQDASLNGWEILMTNPNNSEAHDIDSTTTDNEMDLDFDDQQEDEYEYEDEYEDEDEDEYRWHAEYERTEVKDSELQMFSIDLPPEILEKYSFLRDLPPDVALMGGTARSIAREVITGDIEPARDIDLIRISDAQGGYESAPEVLDELAQEYMPDDYYHGHGIQTEELDRYFRTRDFTVNQSLVLNGKLIVSDLAYNDFQENIIRPAYNRLPYTDEELSDYLFLKALMLVSVLEDCCSSVPTTEDLGEKDYCSDFNMALFLNKAMGRGADIALKFTNHLADYDLIPERLRYRPKATAKWLLSDEHVNFNFRDSMDERFQTSTESVLPSQSVANTKQFSLPIPPIALGEFDAWDEASIRDIYKVPHRAEDGDGISDVTNQAMKKYHSSNSVISKVLAEYDSPDYPYSNPTHDDFDMPSPEELGIPPLEEIEDDDEYYAAKAYIREYDKNYSLITNQIVEDTDELYSGRYSDADFEEINNYYNQSYRHPDYDSYRNRIIIFHNNDGDYDDDPSDVDDSSMQDKAS